MRVAEGRPKTIVAARLRENKYGRRTTEKMRLVVLCIYVTFKDIRLHLRMTVMSRRSQIGETCDSSQ